MKKDEREDWAFIMRSETVDDIISDPTQLMLCSLSSSNMELGHVSAQLYCSDLSLRPLD